MRITIVYRYFWPDQAPYSQLLAKMVPWLIESGHEVRIISGQPTYSDKYLTAPKNEKVFGANVTRLSLLPEFVPASSLVNMLLFSLIAAMKVLFGARQDVVWFGTTPPVMQAFFVGITARLRGAKTIYQMQDIHPAIAIEAGAMKPSVITKILETLDKYTINRTDYVTVLSEDMREQVLEMVGSGANLRVINNFAVEADIGKQGIPANTPVRFCYAGNIGRFQNINALVHEFAKVDPKIAVLELVGDGKLRSELEAFCKKETVASIKFLGLKNTNETAIHIAECDYGIVCLKSGLHRYAFPSKIQTYLAAGTPLFALVDGDSKIATMIENSKLGFHVDWLAGSSEIQKMIVLAAKVASKKTTAYSFPRSLWHPEVAKMQWLSLLDELESTK